MSKQAMKLTHNYTLTLVTYGKQVGVYASCPSIPPAEKYILISLKSEKP